MARSGLLHVPGDECRQTEGRRALRVHLQPQLRRPPGPRWAHASGVAGDGRCGGGNRPPDGRADAVKRGGVEWLAPADAIAVVLTARADGIPLLGFDAALLGESSTQP